MKLYSLYKRKYFINIESLQDYFNDHYITIKHEDKLFINLYYKIYRKFENESFEGYSEIGKYDTVTYFKRHLHKVAWWVNEEHQQ